MFTDSSRFKFHVIVMMHSQSTVLQLCKLNIAKSFFQKMDSYQAFCALSSHCFSRHKCMFRRTKNNSSSRKKNILRRKFSSSRSLSSFWNLKNPSVTYFQEGSSSSLHDGLSLLDRYIFVKTLVNFYEDVPDGIILDTAYADSRPGEEFDPAVPVIVGVHDTPGSHSELESILRTFAKVGCRTIAPTFPGMCKYHFVDVWYCLFWFSQLQLD